MMNRSDAEGFTPHTHSNIFAAIELSSTAWVIALHLPTKNKISLVRATSGDVDRLLEILERARTMVCAEGAKDPQIHTCYEAGYDGFWLHRLLTAKGIHNQVLDSPRFHLLKRLLPHHVHILEMNGDSFRLAHSKRRSRPARSEPPVEGCPSGMLVSVLHFYSGQPLQNLSGVGHLDSNSIPVPN